MSLWSMNDGSALSGTITTNGTTAVTGSSTNFDPEVKAGDIIVTAGGESVRVLTVTSDTAIVLAAAASGSENGVAATVRKPPTDGKIAIPGTDVFGVSLAEGVAGSDNVTAIGVAVSTALGTETYTGGNTYNGSAPAVTVAAPTTHTVPTGDVNLTDDTVGTITIIGHGMATGTKLTYTSNGNNMEQGNVDIADAAAVYVIRYTADKIKLASSLANANAGTAYNLDDAGNNSQTFVGDTATATATVTTGSVTSVAVQTVGSDYQSVPAVTIAAPIGSGSLDLTAAGVLIVADDEIVVPNNFWTAISTGEAVTYAKGASGVVPVTDPVGEMPEGVLYLIKSGTTNKISLATSKVKADLGTKIVLTAVAGGGVAHTLIGATATATASRGSGATAANTATGFHVGWVKRTVGTGGRAGRIQYETLVAASSISGDHEDIAFVEDA